MKTNVHFWSYIAQFCLEWDMLQTKSYRENQNTHFIVDKSPPPPKNVPFML